MSRADDDIKEMIHTLLKRYMKDHMVDRILMSLDEIMSNEEDGCEFVRLMQKWIDCK